MTRSDLQDGLEYDRMQVEVPMAVNVVHDEPGIGEALELRADLGTYLAAHFGRNEERDPEADWIAREAPVGSDQTRHFVGRQDRTSLQQRQVEPHAESRHAAGACDRIVGGRCADHQTRRREDPVAVSRLHSLVDRKRESEIVGSDDQSLRLRLRHIEGLAHALC